jgi:hypothetical protein
MCVQVEGPDILPDDVVRVIDDMAEVHRLQKDGRGWHDDMVLGSSSFEKRVFLHVVDLFPLPLPYYLTLLLTHACSL